MRPEPWLWLLLLLCCPGAAAPPPDSLSQLAPPQNPKIHLYNAERVLSWESSPLNNGTRPVVYRVQFKYTTGNWHNVTVKSIGVNCTQITATECNFTTASPLKGFPLHFNVSLRVRAELGKFTSAWVTVPWFQHYRNVTVGPPKNISVSPGKNSLIIRLSSPFDIDTTMATFWYYVHYWEEKGIQQVKGPVRSNSILLDDLKPSSVYCLQVKAHLVWTIPNITRPGHLSNSSCYKTTADDSTKVQQVALICLGVLSLLLVLAGACRFLFLKYRGLVKYWFHTPPSIPPQIEEYLKDPDQPILEALDKDSSPKDDAWDSVSIVSFSEKEQENVLQTL
jgi:interferon gamma receptor 2|uniref:Interferon gamma receptor 2 n=1 Tax=Castor canadensis TaxID=51338 RepID=A0A8C0XRI6_CASCN|nr:interferon gamma receptor 2 [Castor canadensis]